MMRLPAAQRWPALENADSAAASAALLEVGVVADDERVLAAELEADLGQALAGDARDHPPDRGRAGEADDGDARVLDERLARLAAEAVDDVEDARGQARLGGEPGEGERGLGRVLGGLEHRGVAAQQRREDLPRDVGDRRVGGDDQAGHAERLADRHRLPVRHRARRRLAVEAAALAGDEVAHLDRSRPSRRARPSATCRSRRRRPPRSRPGRAPAAGRCAAGSCRAR